MNNFSDSRDRKVPRRPQRDLCVVGRASHLKRDRHFRNLSEIGWSRKKSLITFAIGQKMGLQLTVSSRSRFSAFTIGINGRHSCNVPRTLTSVGLS